MPRAESNLFGPTTVEPPPQPVDNARSVELVKDRYLDIVHLGQLTLDTLNRNRPYGKYAKTADYIRELFARAGAVCDFAVASGLITPTQAGEIIRDFINEHPEIPTCGPENVI